MDQLNGMLWGSSEGELGLAALAGFLLVIEVGFRIGRRHLAGNDDSIKAHVSALQGALLGLLALLLGFTFAMALSRYDTRRNLVLEEANAIGTTYLRSRLLPPAQRQGIAQLLRAYVEARLAFYDAGIDELRLNDANTKTVRLQQALWAKATEVAQSDPRSVTMGLFIHSLNDVIDLDEKRLTALESHVPEIVLHLLLAVSAVALGFVAYGSGITGQRRYVSAAVVAALIALVLATILDLDRPRRGLIKVSQDSLFRLKDVLHGDKP